VANISAGLGSTSTNQGTSSIGWAYNTSGMRGGATLTSKAAADIDPLLSSDSCGSGNPPFLILFAGTNDIYYGSSGAATYEVFQTYIASRIAAGWPPSKIVVSTMLPRTGFETDRTTYNEGLIAGAATYGNNLARLDVDVNIGCAECNTNPLYYGDAVHPNNTGQQIVANIICSAIPGASPCPAYPRSAKRRE
jgi:lysophospholipase L1-like esterase